MCDDTLDFDDASTIFSPGNSKTKPKVERKFDPFASVVDLTKDERAELGIGVGSLPELFDKCAPERARAAVEGARGVGVVLLEASSTPAATHILVGSVVARSLLLPA